jgi:hypothetical protein
MNGEFYKFIEPPKPREDGTLHPDYRVGDSWKEEVGLTHAMFRTAFKKLEEQGIVSKRVSQDNRTYITLHWDVLDPMLDKIYGVDEKKENNSDVAELKKRNQELEERVVELEGKLGNNNDSSEVVKTPIVETAPEEEHQSKHLNVTLNEVVEATQKMGYAKEIGVNFFWYNEGRGWKGIIDWIPTLRAKLVSEKPLEAKELKEPKELRYFLRRWEHRAKVSITLHDKKYEVNKLGMLVENGMVVEPELEEKLYGAILKSGVEGFLNRFKG